MTSNAQIGPLVMASEISGLEKMHGYLKCGNLVVRMSLPYIELESKRASNTSNVRHSSHPRNRRRSRRPRQEQASRRGMDLQDRNSYSTNSNKVRTRKSNRTTT